MSPQVELNFPWVLLSLMARYTLGTASIPISSLDLSPYLLSWKHLEADTTAYLGIEFPYGFNPPEVYRIWNMSILWFSQRSYSIYSRMAVGIVIRSGYSFHMVHLSTPPMRITLRSAPNLGEDHLHAVGPTSIQISSIYQKNIVTQ